MREVVRTAHPDYEPEAVGRSVASKIKITYRCACRRLACDANRRRDSLGIISWSQHDTTFVSHGPGTQSHENAASSCVQNVENPSQRDGLVFVVLCENKM